MRFNSIEYLFAYRKTGIFPAIHKNIASMALDHVQGRSGLDLCCSHGLLGQQLANRGGYVMAGIDSDFKAVDLAQIYVDMPVYQIRVDRNNLDKIRNTLYVRDITFIVARRCLPELFGDDLEWGIDFFAAMREYGVRELVLEGRVKTKNATNALHSLEAEIDLVSDSYTPYQQTGNVAYLRVRK
jgi:hypothetical protein